MKIKKKKKTPFINPNAGNVEKGVQFFNNAAGNQAVGEAFEGKISRVEETEEFKKTRTELQISDTEIDQLKRVIISNPNIGDQIKRCPGARKIRIGIEAKNKGKRSGARIIYVNIYFDEISYLIGIFAKADQEDLSNREIKILREIIKKLKNKHKENIK